MISTHLYIVSVYMQNGPHATTCGPFFFSYIIEKARVMKHILTLTLLLLLTTTTYAQKVTLRLSSYEIKSIEGKQVSKGKSVGTIVITNNMVTLREMVGDTLRVEEVPYTQINSYKKGFFTYYTGSDIFTMDIKKMEIKRQSMKSNTITVYKGNF